jgi:hypothetical protein
VPDSAVVKPATPSHTGSPYNPYAPGSHTSPLSGVLHGGSVDNSDDLPKWLDGAPQSEYERFFNTLIYFQKQSAMASKAAQIPPVVGVKCLPHKGAFGFERVSELDYKVNCFAGTGKKISHVAEYRMSVTFIPSGCATEAKIHEQFNNPANRNRKSAAEFYNVLKKVCIIQANPASTSAPVVKVTKVSTDFVTKSLADNADLDKYVNGSHITKKADERADYEAEADAKPKHKQKVIVDDEEESTKEPHDDAACIPGNIFCSKSAN